MRITIGNLLMMLAFGGLLAATNVGLADLDAVWTVVLGAVAVTASVAVGMLGRHLAMTGRKRRAARGVEHDRRPPVVYLRGFEDDEVLAQAGVVRGFIQLSTAEEQLARVMNRIGPFVAIGDPRESLPDLGAARVYVAGDGWQERVIDLLERARLVVLRLSASPGLMWELQTVVARVDPRKVLLLVPGKAAEYEHFAQIAKGVLPHPLPPRPTRHGMLPTISTIVRFDRGWTPELLPIRVSHMRMSLRAPMSPHLLLTLRPVFEDLGVPWSKPRVSIFAVLMVALFVVALMMVASLAVG